LGDLVNYGPNPAEVIDFVREHAAVVIRGNHDHSVAFGVDPHCSARFRAMAEETGRFTKSVLNEEHRHYLRNLPLTATLTADDRKVLMCHASPADSLYEYRREESSLWETDPTPPDINVELVGHTHVPFQRFLEARRIVNPGSVGQPKHGKPEARYAIWQDGEITLVAVPYDFEQTVKKLRSLPLSRSAFEDLAFVLRNGSVPSEVLPSNMP
jgi:diadenosine tetraphosphatase ApaH/serine/threonine PP2A family protein phosphatase